MHTAQRYPSHQCFEYCFINHFSLVTITKDFIIVNASVLFQYYYYYYYYGIEIICFRAFVHLLKLIS